MSARNRIAFYRFIATSITALALLLITGVSPSPLILSPADHSAEPIDPPPRHVGLEIENPRPAATPLPSDPARSIPLNSASWTLIGPAPITNGQTPGSQPVSGRMAAIAAHPSDANTIYISTAGGGVWKTTNGGTSWTPLTDDQATLFMGGGLVLFPADPNIIYAGTGEATNSGLSFYGRGVLKSTDGGSTWTLQGNSVFNRRAISRIRVHPTDSNIVYAATHSAVNGLGGNRGIWKSTDGGANWTNTTTAISSTLSYTDLAMDPVNPDVLYAAVGNVGGSSINGVYKTASAGASWAVAGDFPVGDLTNGRIVLAMAPSDPQTLYAAVINSSTGALYKMMKTVNGGTNWVQLAGTPNFTGGQGWYDTCLAVDPSNPNIVYAGGAAGANSFIKSSNGGVSWSDITVGTNGNGPHVDHHGLGFDANGMLLDGNDGGIWRLDNPSVGSILWTDLNGDLSTIQFNGIAIHPTDPDIAYGSSQDNGTEKFTGSLPWVRQRGGDGGYVRVDHASPNTVYHTYQRQGAGGTAGTGFLERSDNGGASWASKTSGISPSDPALFYMPYVMDPSNASRLLLGTNRVYETVNRADSWTALSAPGTNGWTGSTTIDSLAPAPSDVNTIYAAAGSAFYVTTNHGGTWVNRAPSTGTFKDILVDPTDSLVVYAVRSVFGGAHVYRTTSGGVSWTNISGNLPDIPIQTIELDPMGPGSGDDVLYVGTDAGLYRSSDLGTTWTVFGLDLPNGQVTELQFNATLNILAAGTHGRGLWEILIVSAPTISKADESTACGSSYTSAAPSVTPSTPAPSWSLISGPPGMTIDVGTGAVSWPNPIASAADYTITLQATNPGGSSMDSWALTVKPGDFDGDGVCGDSDTAAFVDHLLDLSVSRPCAADANLNGAVDSLDIADYLRCRLSGP